MRFAARFASCRHAALTVITVSPDHRHDGNDPHSDGTLASARKMLEGLRVTADLQVIPTRPHESIPEAIARTSERLKADMVIVGSEGRDTLREWVVGGVALRLIYLATRPVTVVRPPRRRTRA